MSKQKMTSKEAIKEIIRLRYHVYHVHYAGGGGDWEDYESSSDRNRTPQSRLKDYVSWHADEHENPEDYHWTNPPRKPVKKSSYKPKAPRMRKDGKPDMRYTANYTHHADPYNGWTPHSETNLTCYPSELEALMKGDGLGVKIHRVTIEVPEWAWRGGQEEVTVLEYVKDQLEYDGHDFSWPLTTIKEEVREETYHLD